ncbi:MAG: hypothetical protein ACI9BD_000991, partial [Candidatus Marinamargulisbacteria bacterium]
MIGLFAAVSAFVYQSSEDHTFAQDGLATIGSLAYAFFPGIGETRIKEVLSPLPAKVKMPSRRDVLKIDQNLAGLSVIVNNNEVIPIATSKSKIGFAKKYTQTHP